MAGRIANPRTWSRRAIVGAALASPVAGCDVFTKHWTFEYKLNVYVTERGRSHVGASSLRSVFRPVSRASLDQTQSYSGSAWGEAAPVELGGGRFLVGLLDTVGGMTSSHAFGLLSEHTFPDLVRGGAPAQAREAFASGELFDRAVALRGEVELPAMSWPLFAYFSDITDKTSGRFCELLGQRYQSEGPTSSVSEASLGLSVARVTLQFGASPTSDAIRRLAPWVSDLADARPGYHLLPREDAPFVDRLIFRNFRMEGYTS